MLKRRRLPKTLMGCQRSTAALELALILPLMLVLLAMVYDLTEALILYTEVYSSAHVIVSSASEMAVQASGATILSYDEVQFAESAIWADIPAMRSGYKKSPTTAVTISSVTFSPNSSCAAPTRIGSSLYQFSVGCEFNAYVVWSIAYAPPAAHTSGSSFVQDVRQCEGSSSADNYGMHQVAAGTSIPGSPTAGSTLTYFLGTLPTATAATVSSSSLYGNYYALEAGPTPILVTDVEFTYQPTFRVGYKFNAVISQNINMFATALWPVRSVAYYTTTGYSEPLSQQFTELYGTSSNSLYSALNDVVGGNTHTGGQYSGNSSSWCVNQYEGTPSPMATPPTNGEL